MEKTEFFNLLATLRAQDEQLKKIDIEYGVTVDGAVYRDYLGVIKGSIIYSAESGMFELVEDYYFK